MKYSNNYIRFTSVLHTTTDRIEKVLTGTVAFLVYISHSEKHIPYPSSIA